MGKSLLKACSSKLNVDVEQLPAALIIAVSNWQQYYEEQEETKQYDEENMPAFVMFKIKFYT